MRDLIAEGRDLCPVSSFLLCWSVHVGDIKMFHCAD